MCVNKKMWAILVHLSMHQWNKHYDTLPFDDNMWDYIIKESEKAGINTIVLDVGDGVQFASHPEIAMDGAWTKKRVHDEIRKCKAHGITLIPKLNFATTHDFWLGEYARMISTKTYYKVCYDLIKEIYEIFEHPEYIHIGMDEESAKHVAKLQYAVFRQGELYWHDVRFLLDCVHETGAIPWMWSCPLFENVEDYKKYISPDECVLSPWYYNAFRKEHWTPVESRAEYVAYYNEGMYKEMGIKYVEEDPFLVNFRNVALPLLKEGFSYIPCASVFNRCDWNTHDLLEYFKDNAPDEQIFGYITAPWVPTLPTERSMLFYEESFKFLKEAKETIYYDREGN